jgi:hypothetical protein
MMPVSSRKIFQAVSICADRWLSSVPEYSILKTESRWPFGVIVSPKGAAEFVSAAPESIAPARQAHGPIHLASIES